MYCKFCGNEIEDGSDFCYVCGQRVSPVRPNTDDVYSQAAPAEAATEPAPVFVPEQPVAVADPAQTQPMPAEAPVAADPEQQDGKKKKKKKEKTVYQTKRGVRFVCFLFALIGLIIYSKAKKNGNEVRATECANAIMLGLDFKLAILAAVALKKFMF